MGPSGSCAPAADRAERALHLSHAQLPGLRAAASGVPQAAGGQPHAAWEVRKSAASWSRSWARQRVDRQLKEEVKKRQGIEIERDRAKSGWQEVLAQVDVLKASIVQGLEQQMARVRDL